MFNPAKLCTATLILLIAIDRLPAQSRNASDWRDLPVPGVWESAGGRLATYDGFAWYRCRVRFPSEWQKRDCHLVVSAIDNAFEAYVDGKRVGSQGGLPPRYRNGLSSTPVALIMPPAVWDRATCTRSPSAYSMPTVAADSKGRPPHITSADQAISLHGTWQFRTGDNPIWATADVGQLVTFHKVIPSSELSAASTARKGGPLSPAAAHARFQIGPDFKLDALLSEPLIAQPVFLNFDERGRMWVVQYRQYPHPAGLKILSRDKYWRNRYDRVPQPPPHHTRGLDRISIHEDSDGDGTFDKHRIFVEGLNIATACVARAGRSLGPQCPLPVVLPRRRQ